MGGGWFGEQDTPSVIAPLMQDRSLAAGFVVCTPTPKESRRHFNEDQRGHWTPTLRLSSKSRRRVLSHQHSVDLKHHFSQDSPQSGAGTHRVRACTMNKKAGAVVEPC